METQCIRVRLNKNDLDAIRKWFKELNRRKDEVIQTLKNENIVVESAFIDHFQDEYFLIYYVKAKNLKEALSIFENSQLPIDLYFKEQWELFCNNSVKLENILDLDIIKSLH